MLFIACLLAATIVFMLLVPERRVKNGKFDWNARRLNWWRRWRAGSAFPNDR
jgi:hypothetical protein